MNELIDRNLRFLTPGPSFKVLAGLFICSQLFVLGLLSYIGTYTRYLADDYCEIVILRDGFLPSNVFGNYLEGRIRASNRFSNLLFIGISEGLGEYNVQVLPFLMILIWLVGLIWLMTQLHKLSGFPFPGSVDYLAAITILFFSAWQAPNRFQIFFWRSGMATHFVPLVFMTLFCGFILYRINLGKKIGFHTSLGVFLGSFLIGGFSEPPAAFLIVLIFILLPIIWRWDDATRRQITLNLIIYCLGGTLFALLAMFFAPGNLTHGNTSLENLLLAFGNTIRFTVNFMDDTVRTLPLPSLVSVLTGLLVFFILYIKSEKQDLDSYRMRQIWMWVLLVPFIQFLLIAASFGPSAYGQSYPAERAQFLGRLIMTVALLLEGALLGVLFAHAKIIISRRRFFIFLGILTLFILAFYPLRAGLSLLDDIPEYRQWTSTWDLRQMEINNSIAMGEQDLVVRWLPTKDGVKEIDGDTGHWVNRCVAEYYGVNTIRSVPMDNEK